MTSYDALLATLAAYAYQTNRRVADRITLPLPLEVTRVASATDSASGFEAYAFRYQGQTIIAFSGTAPGLADAAAFVARISDVMHSGLNRLRP